MKQYIVGMSLEKDKVMKKLNSFSSVLMDHMIKLIVYSDIRPDDVSGWIHDIANWIHEADSVTVKPSAKKLKEKELLSSLFSYMGDEIKDYRLCLSSFLADNISGKFNYNGKPKYPNFEVTDELAENLMNACYFVMDSTIPLILDKSEHSINEYEAVIRNVL